MTWFLVLYLLFRCAAIPRWNFFFAFRASLRPLSSLHCLSSSQPFPCTCPPHRQSCCKVSDKNKKPVVCCSLHLFISLLGIRRSTRLRAPILGPCPQTTTSAQTSSCRHFFIFPLFAFSTFTQFQCIAFRFRLPKMTIFHLVNCQIYGHV